MSITSNVLLGGISICMLHHSTLSAHLLLPVMRQLLWRWQCRWKIDWRRPLLLLLLLCQPAMVLL